MSAAAVPDGGGERGDNEEEEQRGGDPHHGRHGDGVKHGHADAAKSELKCWGKEENFTPESGP